MVKINYALGPFGTELLVDHSHNILVYYLQSLSPQKPAELFLFINLHKFQVNMSSWFLDFEGFHFPGRGGCGCESFIVKEIAIVNKEDKDKCFNYFITGPKGGYVCDGETFNYQLRRHQLMWEFGDYEFVEAMTDVARKLKDGTVYIKGKEKFDYISHLFPSPKFVELQGIPALKSLNSCMSERCSVRHGNRCARRKVHELLHYVTNSN